MNQVYDQTAGKPPVRQGRMPGSKGRKFDWRGLRRHVPAQYLWPILMLLGICFGCIVGVLVISTSSQDRLQLARERQGLATALDTAVALTIRDLQDYAKWDEAVRHIARDLDPAWMADNVVAYLGETQGYTYIFTLDGADRTVFASQKGKTVRLDARRVLGQGFSKGVARVRTMTPTGAPIIGGYSRAGDDLYVYSVAQIVPLTDKVRLGKGPVSLLVVAQRIDGAFLARMAADESLQGLRLHLDRPPPAPRIELPSDNAPLDAWLSWHPAQPGTALRRDALPATLAVALLTIIAAGIVVKRGARTVEALQVSEARARYQALHDALTGLPNRRALMERISQAVAAMEPVRLLYMDLDGFKDANDLYGHGAGDKLLRQAAQRITAALPYAFAARAGGDEFAVLVRGNHAQGQAHMAEAVIDAFATPFSTGDFWVDLGVSIGCVDRPAHSMDDEDDIMRHADAAMYAAKADGKRCWRSYRPEMDAHHHVRVELEADLREAIEGNAIDVVYQPIVDAHSRAIVAVEALARWRHMRHGDVPPDVFIPLAERSGLISALGQAVLQRACRDVLPLPVSLAVNLSPAQFWDSRLGAEISEALDQTGFPAERLELEITEQFLLRRPEAAADILRELRLLGISIALDDFGAGYASIGYLRQLSFDRLKIDKQFIAPISERGSAAELVGVIAALGRLLELEVTAEGVETPLQAELACRAGCSQLQGWHFGRPMPIEILCANLAGDDAATPLAAAVPAT
ncbi:bifunctional diguanylate cyclase/phosphodiesterase [Sphingomonas sp. DBB INV C78]